VFIDDLGGTLRVAQNDRKWIPAFAGMTTRNIEQGIPNIEVEIRDTLHEKNSYPGVKVFTYRDIRNTHHEIRVTLL